MCAVASPAWLRVLGAELPASEHRSLQRRALPSPPLFLTQTDPLGLGGKSKDVLNYYAGGEIYNGRWAMLAVAGILVTDLLGRGDWWTAGATVESSFDLKTLIAVEVAVFAVVESLRINHWTKTGSVRLNAGAGVRLAPKRVHCSPWREAGSAQGGHGQTGGPARQVPGTSCGGPGISMLPSPVHRLPRGAGCAPRCGPHAALCCVVLPALRSSTPPSMC